MVYYRKYRPQKVSELDLGEVRSKIELILAAKEIPHAFLFTGPKGLGKTSSARILAKAINCDSKFQVKSKKSEDKEKVQQSSNETVEPCNACDACVSITNGSNIDVIEIDAASNRGIDEIRDLREKIKFSPSNLVKKVYIIDEVHMLTTDAFNALLKTLEEPPSHAIFILCTTEVEKVPGTIVSRTFHVQFKKPTKEEIIHSLNRVAKGENIEIEKEVLDEIFKLSEGSFRDASKILEELVIAEPKEKITIDTFSKSFNTVSLAGEAENLLSILKEKDSRKALKLIEDLSQKGTDFKVFTEIIAQVLHDKLLIAGIAELRDLKRLLDLVNESFRNIKLSVLPQIPLELVVVEWCLENGSKKHELRIEDSGIEKQKEISEKSLEITKSEDPKAKSQEPSRQSSSQTSEQKDPETKQKGHGIFAENSKLDHFAAALISAVKQDNHSIAGILRGARLSGISSGNVQFETRFKFHRDRLSDPKVSKILDQRASEILKEKVRVIVNLSDK